MSWLYNQPGVTYNEVGFTYNGGGVIIGAVIDYIVKFRRRRRS